jgi:hypothetical protein
MARSMSPSRCSAPHGYGDIVDGAESFAVIRKGMVKTAAHVVADAVLERQPRRQHGAAGRQPEAFHQVARVGNLQLQNLLVAERAVREFFDPGAIVRQQQVFVGGRLRSDEVLFHRETASTACGRAAT